MDKKIVLIGLLTVCIFSILSMTASAADNIEWVEKKDGAKLYWGETINIDGYDVKAEDFNEEGMVFVSISKDGEKLKTSPLTAGLEFEYNDEIIYPDKVRINLNYISHWSFWLDIKIIIYTVLGKKMKEPWLN